MNPIEYFFGYIKFLVKNKNYDQIYETIEEAIKKVTEQQLKGWIHLSKKYWDSNSL
jgi:hypothetical protein